MKKLIAVIVVGAVVIGIGIAVLLIALGLNGWKFSPDFKTEEFKSSQENTTLKVKLSAGELKIEYHDEDYVQILYPTASGYQTKITEADGKLSVDGNKRRWYTFSWGIKIPETVVKIPRGKIADLEIELNAGTVSLAEGAFENVKIELNAGTVSAAGIQCNKFTLKINAGSANVQKLDGAENKIEVNAGSANVKFTGTAEDYTATVKVSAGSCNGVTNRTGGGRTIDVKVNAGSVNASFLG